MRKLSVFGVAIIAALTGSGAPHAQTPATNQRVWTGTWEQHDSWEGSNKFGRSQAQISFVYVEGRDEFGLPRWESRRLTWSALWEESIFDHLQLGLVGGPDERGFIRNRYPTDIVTSCTGGGTLELGPAVAGGGDDLTPEQQEQLRPACVTTYQPRESSVPTPPPTLSKRDALPAPSMPYEGELTGCAYEKSWPGHPSGSFSVSVSAPVTAIMEVSRRADEAYAQFVPTPGATLTFTASVPSGTARFRFELDPEATSSFPGYATNANIDEVFFEKYNLAQWRGQYANDGPDVLFDRWHFTDQQEWSRVEPLVVETARSQSAAVVTITTMDYAAVGKLRVFVKSEECGDWLPVPVRFGSETRDAVSIPMDEDNNLIADALETYRGLDPGADGDAEPKGNGMGGDGMTVFEEYRGFLVRGAGCGAEETRAAYSALKLQNQSQVFGESDEHTRTSAVRKDIFIHTPDAELALTVPAFGTATDLDVHLICQQHYVNNDTRVVNFTLHQAGLRDWRGRVISHDEPQHGIYLEPVLPFGLRGLAVPVTEGYMGPPKLTRVVQVTKPRPDSGCVACLLEYSELVHTVVHELGHAVGVPHHGDLVDDAWRHISGRQNIVKWLSLQQHAGGPPDFTQPNSVPADPANHYAAIEGRNYLASLLVEPGGSCAEGAQDAVFYKDGKFAGCEADSIARRGQQNSGEFECPMRYSGSDYYEAPETIAQFRWTDRVTRRNRSWNQWEPGYLVDAWGGRLLKYRNELDRDGDGRFCTRINGTGINGLPGPMNHSGDAGRSKACAEFIVVNDFAARGIQ